MKCATTRVMKHNMILHSEMSPTHQRKRCMKDREVYPPFNYPNILLAIQSVHRSSFLVTPLLSYERRGRTRNDEDEISFKGEDCNTLCYGDPNKVT
jgi:hypothetical protein